jgi:hypothetical protein
MKKIKISAQLVVALAILVIGGGAVGGEVLLVKWWPAHKQRVADETLAPVPYHNESLGLDMEVAAGIYGKAAPFPGGVKISRSKFLGVGPSITITVQPNPDKTFDFSPEILAKWQTRGVMEESPRYSFEHTEISKRDAALIWQYKNDMMWVTAHIMSPDRIVQADCTPGKEDEALYLQACEQSLRSIKLAGPLPPEATQPQGVIELNPRKR